MVPGLQESLQACVLGEKAEIMSATGLEQTLEVVWRQEAPEPLEIDCPYFMQQKKLQRALERDVEQVAGELRVTAVVPEQPASTLCPPPCCRGELLLPQVHARAGRSPLPGR